MLCFCSWTLIIQDVDGGDGVTVGKSRRQGRQTYAADKSKDKQVKNNKSGI